MWKEDDDLLNNILNEYLSLDGLGITRVDVVKSTDETTKGNINAKVKDFTDTIGDYNEMDFKTHLRLDRSTVERLVCKYIRLCSVRDSKINMF